MKKHASLAAALAPHASKIAQLKIAPKKFNPDDLLSLRRDLVAIEIEGFGQAHVFVPPSATESDVFRKAIIVEGEVESLSYAGIVDLLIAGVRDENGRLLFKAEQKAALLEKPSEVIGRFWRAIGAAYRRGRKPLTQDEAEKK